MRKIIAIPVALLVFAITAQADIRNATRPPSERAIVLAGSDIILAIRQPGYLPVLAAMLAQADADILTTYRLALRNLRASAVFGPEVTDTNIRRVIDAMVEEAVRRGMTSDTPASRTGLRNIAASLLLDAPPVEEPNSPPENIGSVNDRRDSAHVAARRDLRGAFESGRYVIVGSLIAQARPGMRDVYCRVLNFELRQGNRSCEEVTLVLDAMVEQSAVRGRIADTAAARVELRSALGRIIFEDAPSSRD